MKRYLRVTSGDVDAALCANKGNRFTAVTHHINILLVNRGFIMDQPISVRSSIIGYEAIFSQEQI